MRACNSDGTALTTIETCASNALCQAGLATGACAPPACAVGEMKCDGADRFACLADRTGFAPTKTDTCDGNTPVCAQGKCIACVNDTARCSGKTPEVCTAEMWQSQTACGGTLDATCSGGSCIDVRFARWPMPNDPSSSVHPAKYTTVSANIVRDEVTGLEWQRGVSSSAIDTSGSSYPAACEGLVLDGVGGWHTPTAVELLSLMIFGKGAAPYIDTTVFNGTPTGGLTAWWPGTSWPRIDYDTRAIATESILGSSYYVRCVRSPARPPTGTRFTVANNEITDAWTKLVWKDTNLSTGTYFANATSGCTALGNGYRLPTVKELYTLVDPTVAGPKFVDPAFSTMSLSGYYWSSTLGPTSSVYTVDFGSSFGAIYIQGDSGVTNPARCVR